MIYNCVSTFNITYNFTACSYCEYVRPKSVIVSFLAVCALHGEMTAAAAFCIPGISGHLQYTQKAQTNARALVHLVKLVNLMTLFVIVSRLGDYNVAPFFSATVQLVCSGDRCVVQRRK